MKLRKRTQRLIVALIAGILIIEHAVCVQAAPLDVYFAWNKAYRHIQLERTIASVGSEAEAQTDPSKTYTYDFSLYQPKFKKTLCIELVVDKPIDAEFTLIKNGKTTGKPIRFSKDDQTWQHSKSLGSYTKTVECVGLGEGDYRITVTYADVTPYELEIYYKGWWRQMEEKSFLSKGFTMQFPIGDATIESVAVSGDKGVTTYDQEKNILKANKVGAVRYVLQLSNDVMLYEYVTVVQNRYIGDGCKKPTKVEQGQKGKALMKAYDGYYDRTGKLIIKAALMNHTSKKVTKKNIKVTVRDEAGQTVASGVADQKSITVAANSIQYATFTIQPGGQKIRKTNLANASIRFSGVSNYEPLKFNRTMYLPTIGATVKVIDRYNNEGLVKYVDQDSDNDGEPTYIEFMENCQAVTEALDHDIPNTQGMILYTFARFVGLYFDAYNWDADNDQAVCAIQDKGNGTYVLKINDHFAAGYQCIDNGNIRTAYCQDALLATLACVSSTPQKLYEGIYDICYGEKIYQANRWYTFGDSQVCYKSSDNCYLNQTGIKAIYYIKEK